MYYDLNFARGRLRNTILSIKGRACLVNDVIGEDQLLMCHDLETMEPINIGIDEEGVSLIPPKMGYIYIPNVGARYYERHPERRWKQGIPFEIFRGIAHLQKHIGKSLNGNYKSFRQCLRCKRVTPFHRLWAVGDGVLYYRGRVVGTVTREGVTTLNQENIYLKEYLEEVIR